MSAENWAAVANASTDRMTELGLRQRELAERSGVSQAMVREIQRNTVERRRGERTLEAISGALRWHPQHLTAILHNRRPPALGEPREDMRDPVTARLAVIEDRLTKLTTQLSELRAEVTAALDNRDAR